MPPQERDRIDARTVQRAADFIAARVRRFECADGNPYTAFQVVDDVAYVARTDAGNFGGVYVRKDLLAHVALQAVAIVRTGRACR